MLISLKVLAGKIALFMQNLKRIQYIENLDNFRCFIDH